MVPHIVAAIALFVVTNQLMAATRLSGLSAIKDEEQRIWTHVRRQTFRHA
jgi:hypothetical protein